MCASSLVGSAQIGAFANGDFPFDGRIGAVTVFASALTNTQVFTQVNAYYRT